MYSNSISSKLLACLLIICATCGLSCRRKTPQPESKETKVEADAGLSEPTTVAKTELNNIAVTINGVEITEDQIDKMLEPQLAAMAEQNQNRSPEFVEQMKKLLRQQTVERVIIEQLIDEKAKQANITITEEDINNQIKEVASMQRPPVSVEEFRGKLEGMGLSFDEVKQQIRRGLTFEKMMQTQFADEINITEADAKKYYDQYPNRYKTPEQVKASHILIKVDTADPNSDPNEAKAKALAKAEELLEQIKAGADFAELAKANSDCPSATRGGDLGFFGKERMVPPFEKAAFELEVGQISDVVETEFGYHIIKVTDHKDASVTTFEQAKDDIIKRLMQTRHRELVTKYIESLKAGASIVYPPGKEPRSAMPSPAKLAPPPKQIKPVEPEAADANQ